ncbi:MAG: hypothetical protein KF850_13295 [Labilithrix sp.]|nr:hypothetical protein [Labilithrix sp.]
MSGLEAIGPTTVGRARGRWASRAARAAIGAALALGGLACEPYPGSGSTSSSASSSSGASGASSGASGSSGRRPINADKLCTRLVTECGQAVTMDVCRRQFTAILVTGACADVLATASCADLTTSSSPALETCFPACAGTLASCNDDGSITICTAAGTTNVLDCEEACKADGARVYTGTCGLSHGAQISDTPQCWCR